MTLPRRKLKEVAGFVNGKAYKPSDWSPQGIPIIRIQNLNGADKPFNYWAGTLERQVRVKTNDLLLAWSGTPGTSFGAHIWDGPDAVLNQHIFRVDLDENEVTKAWAKFVINAQLETLIGLAHGGVGLKHVTRGMVEELEIPVPRLSEQRRITAVLDQAERLIEKRREALELLDNLTQSVFMEMFGDPTLNPKNYPEKPLGSLVDAERGITYGIVQRGEDCEEGVPVLRITDVVKGQIDLGRLKRTTHGIAAKYRRTILKGGELVISIRGTVGRCGIVPKELAGGNITRELALIPFNEPKNSIFLLALLRHSSIQRKISGDIKGVAQSGINLEDLRKLNIILPPQEERTEFVRRIQALERLVKLHRESLSELDILCSSLQHNVLHGEL